jgi:hypothetical protein
MPCPKMNVYSISLHIACFYLYTNVMYGLSIF